MSASDRELVSMHDELAKASTDALSEKSPLMIYLLERFGRANSRSLRAQRNAFFYMMWCMRRAVMSYTHNTEYFHIMQQIDDLRTQQFCQALANANDPASRDLATIQAAFRRFDEAVADELSRDAWVASLGLEAMKFIVDGERDSDPARELVAIGIGPAAAFLAAHEIARPILAKRLGLRLST